MKLEELLAKLEENAQFITKPNTAVLPGIGIVYVRKRTVKEFEEMAAVRAAERNKEGQDSKDAKTDPVGLFGPSLAQLLCDEQGNRFSAKDEAALAAILAKQPEDVFHAITEAADGKSQAAKEPVPGN